MAAPEPPLESLGALLAKVGLPWFEAIIVEEAALPDTAALLQAHAAGTLVDTLVEAGLEKHHAEAIAAELDKLRASRAQPAASVLVSSAAGARASAGPAPDGAGDASQAQPSTFTAGGIYNPRFLSAILPLFDMHMGAENVAPLLYSLLRFVKPTSALEVGGGFTTIFLLQALEDNAAEAARYRQLRAAGQDRVGNSGTQWSCDAFFAPSLGACGGRYVSMADRVERAQLHCIDNMAHEHTTANKVVDVARALGVDHRLRLHVNDAFDPDLPATLAPGVTFDFIWIDLGAAHRLGGFFDGWWPRLCAAGGHVAVHSTLTNQLTRDWLERVRALPRGVDGPMGDFEQVSLLEQHKLFQNSITLLKKRGDALSGPYAEPVHSKYP